MLFRFVLVLACLCISFGIDIAVVPAAKLSASPYHRWAHEHWVWNSNGYSNQVNVTQLVDDYAKHDIKVGGVDIDSTWATEYNNFEVSTDKFPNFQSMVEYIHSKDIRVILWATSFINEENPDFQMAKDNKWLVRNHKGEVPLLKWWHGKGGLLDYSNPDAREWFHNMMDRVLVLPNGDGVDGFKCDASDPYIIEYMVGPNAAALGYNDVPYSGYHEYADMYYGDFFNHTRVRRGEEGLIMSRPVDCIYPETGEVCMQQSPKFVMTSGWVGDDDATMQGLRECARKVIYSAWDGYANYGCDIGGYRNQAGQSMADTKEHFLRSAQFNAFLPLMENGGGGEHRPWMIDPSDKEIVNVYRDLVNQHTRLSPYLLTVGSNALETDTSSITPLAINSEDRKRPRSHRKYSQPSTYAYLLGPDVFVHPPMYAIDEKKEGHDTSVIDIIFPGMSTDTWLDWWHPTIAKLSHQGGSKKVRVVPLREYPVYVRAGSLMPLWEDGVVGGSDSLAAAHTTFTWFAPKFERDTQPVVTQMREPVEDGPGMIATALFTSANVIEVRITAHKGAVGLSLIDVSKPTKVSIKGSPCKKHMYNLLTHTLDVKCEFNNLGSIITVEL